MFAIVIFLLLLGGGLLLLDAADARTSTVPVNLLVGAMSCALTVIRLFPSAANR